MASPPLLFFHLLADRKLAPAGVNLQIGSGAPEELNDFLATEEFTSYTAAFPCFIKASNFAALPPEVSQQLSESGCHALAEDQLFHTEGQDKPELPANAHWLSGLWYRSPPAKLSKNQDASRALSLKLLQLVANDADTCEIEEIFRHDPVLAYHLLRLVNSLGVGVGRHISSFSQAILILGRQQLKRWLNLMLFAASQDDYRSLMLLAHVTIRARRMELLAKASGFDRMMQEQAFMSGMFSLLGTLFGMPLTEVLTPLNLNDTLSTAVLGHAGHIGQLLNTIEQAEIADEAQLTALLAKLNVSAATFNSLSLEAHHWMLGVIHEKRSTHG